jgi:acyl carrier protein phosphodiesterase
MNYLAHAYLSFGNTDLLVGNMISDFVKGAKQYDYPALIQNGIRLHREIDQFTDVHKATAAGKAVFRSSYGLYSGAVLDVIYDHFLASDEKIFTDMALQDFSSDTYQVLEEQSAHLPQGFLVMLPYMKMHNWLYNYRKREGIEQSLRGLIRRAAYLTDHQPAYKIFEERYAELQSCYDDFFPDVKEFAKRRIRQLIS